MLDATNDYETFVETFEGVAFRGFPGSALQVISTIGALGGQRRNDQHGRPPRMTGRPGLGPFLLGFEGRGALAFFITKLRPTSRHVPEVP